LSLFGAGEEPLVLAGEVESRVATTRRDAFDMLTLASMPHRHLDEAMIGQQAH
jgi:hypothetical protein